VLSVNKVLLSEDSVCYQDLQLIQLQMNVYDIVKQIAVKATSLS
jgi:hypothetical protein